jgi:hypothetical protein
MSFLLNKLEKEPKIVALENPINFVGLSIKTDMKNIYKDAAKLECNRQNHSRLNPSIIY